MPTFIQLLQATYSARVEACKKAYILYELHSYPRGQKSIRIRQRLVFYLSKRDEYRCTST